MYNYEDLLKNVGETQATIGDFQRSHATLHLFSPKMMPTQVLRSYSYNFNQGFLNEIVGHGESLQKTVGPSGLGMTSDFINKAILPDTNGIILDTYTLNQQWSFVLIIDDEQFNHGIRNAMPGPECRIIAVGYTNVEPINPLTGTVNPNAVLIFTHTTVTFVNNEVGMLGTMRSFTCNSNTDFVGEMNAQLTNEPLFIGTPGDISNNVGVFHGEDGNPEIVGNYADMSLSNMKIDAPARNVNSILNSPKHQLNSIMNALDNAINRTSDGEFLKSSVLPDAPDNRADAALDHFKSNVIGSQGSLPRHGIDTSHPMTISELEWQYSNLIVKPYMIPGASQWDVSPQDVQTVRNSMSSMVAATVSSLLPGCGILSIMFRYNSWFKVDQFDAKPAGAWSVMELSTSSTTTPQQTEQRFNTFKDQCEWQLFPILKAVHGEFDLTVYCNSSGEILVDLNFMDDVGAIGNNGWYETNNRLGGLLNPMVSSIDNISHNINQIQQAVGSIIGMKLGPESFRSSNTFLQNEPVGMGEYVSPGVAMQQQLMSY